MTKKAKRWPFHHNPQPWKYTPGDSLTIPGQAMSITEHYLRLAGGQAVAVNPTIPLPPINDVLEDHFDLPDVSKYMGMDPVDKAKVRANVEALSSHLKGELDSYNRQLKDAEHLARQKEALKASKTPGEEPGT